MKVNNKVKKNIKKNKGNILEEIKGNILQEKRK